jgi:hypothetical protein
MSLCQAKRRDKMSLIWMGADIAKAKAMWVTARVASGSRLLLMPRIVDARLPAAPLWFRGDRDACVKLQPAAMVMRLDVQRSSSSNTRETSATLEEG